MELLGDEAQLEACFGPFGDSANLDEVHGLRRTYYRLKNRLGCTRWKSQVSGSCGILFQFIWTQCQCRCNIGSRFVPNILYTQKSIWTHLMVLLGDEAQVEARFVPFGDGANLAAR
jgi:hypothetical protein